METEHDSAVVELTTFIELLSDIAILVRRSDGRLVGTNEAAIAAYGYTGDELLSLTIHNLRAPETLAQAKAQMAQADADGLRFETIHLRKGGERFRVEVNSRCALHNGSRVLLSVVRDVSERDRAAFFDALVNPPRPSERLICRRSASIDSSSSRPMRCRSAGSRSSEVQARTWVR